MHIRLRNRLEVLMKDSGVPSFEEMAQRLTENQNWTITRTSLSRKFRDEDVALSLKLIEAICNELQCLPGDIFETEISGATEEFVSSLRARLQPFRYGSIRVVKDADDASSKDDQNQYAKPSPATDKGKRKKPSRTAPGPEDVAGPRVTHLHVGMVKQKK